MPFGERPQKDGAIVAISTSELITSEAIVIAASQTIMEVVRAEANKLCGKSKLTFAKRASRLAEIQAELTGLETEREKPESVIRRLAELRSWVPKFSE